MLKRHHGISAAIAVTMLGATSLAYAQQTRVSPSQAENVPVRDLRAQGDPDKHYFLIGLKEEAKPPQEGYKLLLVLPGGDGGQDFHPFVRRIWARALEPGYLVAQLVSKEWTPGQSEQLVWPTAINPWNGMKFSTEEFADAVIEDVKTKATVDSDRVYVLAWSSGGPAAYTMTLLKDTPIKGAFIAMSVFKPRHLPNLQNAKGRSFYLLHSPEDFIPMTMPEQARMLLRKRGAEVHLDTYPGGHGWQGDVFGLIRTGMEWLSEHSTTP